MGRAGAERPCKSGGARSVPAAALFRAGRRTCALASGLLGGVDEFRDYLQW